MVWYWELDRPFGQDLKETVDGEVIVGTEVELTLCFTRDANMACCSRHMHLYINRMSILVLKTNTVWILRI
jgi:hypothetical protein